MLFTCTCPEQLDVGEGVQAEASPQGVSASVCQMFALWAQLRDSIKCDL